MTEGNRQQGSEGESFAAVDGAAIAARILRRYPSNQRQRLIKAMAEQAPVLAEKVQEKMYSLEELRSVSKQGIEALVREVPHRDLVAAVAGAPEPLQQKLLDGMTQRRRKMVEEDSSMVSRDLDPKQVKEAQWRLVQKLDELKEREAEKPISKKGTWA